MRPRLKFYIQKNLSRNSIDLYVMAYEGPRSEVAFVAQPVVIKELKDGEDIGEPTLVIERNAFQEFIDQLWADGFRPSNIQDQNAFDSQTKHLEDMRKIVFAFLKKEGIE